MHYACRYFANERYQQFIGNKNVSVPCTLQRVFNINECNRIILYNCICICRVANTHPIHRLSLRTESEFQRCAPNCSNRYLRSHRKNLNIRWMNNEHACMACINHSCFIRNFQLLCSIRRG